MDTTTVCFRHPDRRGGVSCQRCGRPICPSCMTQASVGFHCPECAHQGRQRVYTARSLRARARPVVTIGLVVVNVAVFLLGLVQGGTITDGGGDLQVDGALIGGAVFRDTGFIGVDAGEWWRIVTSGFLHAGVMHLGFNMLLLWMLGQVLEPALGRLRFGLLYAVSLIAGSFGALLLDPGTFTVGASGAVFGLMGALVVVQWSRGMSVWDTGIGGLIGINLFITFVVPGISVGGHVGGLLGGLAAAWLLVDLPRRITVPPVVPVLTVVALGVALWAGCLEAASHWI